MKRLRLLALAVVLTTAPHALAQTLEVLLVGNNWDGTVDVIGPHTLARLGRIDVAPDFEQRIAEMTPDQRAARELNNEFAAEGHDQLVDDMRVSPDGKVLYVSRPSLGDAAAFDLTSPVPGRAGNKGRRLLWHTNVSGYRSDHTALSPDGSRLLVSATITNVIEVIDTATGRIVGQIPTGDFPHENDYSHDGTLIFNGSIGRVIAPDDPALDAGKGNRWFTIADAATHAVRKVIDFGVGIRPFVVLPDNRTMYVQLSFLHGLVEYDLQEARPLRTVDLPVSEEAQQLAREDYPLDSAHHGLALNRRFTRICVAATVSNYAAILRRRSLRVVRIIPVGQKPYWATASTDGRYCFVANSDTDDVSVISFGRAREVRRLPVGDHPQRMRMSTISTAALAP